MTEQIKSSPKTEDYSAKITVSKNGPYIVTGGVPLSTSEICNDDDGNCRTWREVKRYQVQEKYTLLSADDRRTNRSKMAAILKDKNEQERKNKRD
jgi:hypothetical protein